ncbi:uroporphyrinogen-III C-methyltransferase [Bordetella genomosp. 11]|uniref:Heme biosynthesis operon protein HemX n=1 Tax=Bordetella genomosp. 11 TaxID=1416808 RepID=A0A261UE79_9BORD|nr:uroporphyrinogen-III C-methyltransferase [Bordetella genomosp. 11]OZI59895.1 heme biosynthesis operon protein HemX [Bordetella genomosp. 11]
MTEKTPATDPAAAPVVSNNPTSADMKSAGPKNAASSPPSPRAARKGGASPLVATLVVVVLLALVLVAALWMQRQQFLAAGREIATRLDALNSALNQTRSETRQALALAQVQSDKVAALEASVQETQSQYTALEQAWQDFNDNVSDDVLINDVERLLTIADQQLRLGGSVSNAIVAMETAQSRLARAGRPRYASLQQTINGDLDRLRAVKTIDVPIQAGRIERLVALVGKAPLLVPDAVTAGAGSAAPADAPAAAGPAPAPVGPDLPPDAAWWQRWRAEIASWPARAGGALAHELGDLVRVQRVDEPAALLLSTEQAEQLRSTLRQRLLTVQLALLMRQPVIWKNELDTVSRTLDTYYDRRSPDTLAALGLARELAQIQIATPMPDLSDSLSAIAALRADGSGTVKGRD